MKTTTKKRVIRLENDDNCISFSIVDQTTIPLCTIVELLRKISARSFVDFRAFDAKTNQRMRVVIDDYSARIFDQISITIKHAAHVAQRVFSIVNLDLTPFICFHVFNVRAMIVLNTRLRR